MLWLVKALEVDSPGSDAVAWKDSRLISPPIKYPLADHSA